MGDPDLSGIGELVEAGTPNYIAPETARGDWRDFGPPTDLYSLGCMAWHLATGVPPFARGNTIETISAHLYKEPPAFDPQLECPQGFEPWLRKMMAKLPEQRFQRASDAALALVSLADSPQDPPRRPPTTGDSTVVLSEAAVLGSESVPTETLPTEDMTRLVPRAELRRPPGGTETTTPPHDDPLPPPRIIATTSQFSIDLVKAASEAMLRGPAANRHPIPTDWREGGQPPLPVHLHDAGMGLCALRSPPFSGRERERGLLWDALQRCRQSEGPSAVVLEGAGGLGKSRLAQWLAQRAHELGAAICFKAGHSPTGGIGEGLEEMFTYHFNLSGLERAAQLTRLDCRLSRTGIKLPWDEAAALVELMSQHEDGSDPPDRHHPLRSDSERYAVMLRHLIRSTHERVGVLWLDDAQWGADSLRFAHYVLSQRDRLPCAILILITLETDRGDLDTQVQALLEEIYALEDSVRIEVPRLTEEEHTEVLRGFLPLSRALRSEVFHRSGGNPMFAVEMVRGWAQQSLLEPGKEGYESKRGARLKLPDDLSSVWVQRLEASLGDLSEEAEKQLWAGAALGRSFDHGEWSALCSEAELGSPEELGERLLASGLWESSGSSGRLHFSHELLWETILDLGRAAGQLKRIHSAAADILADPAAAGSRPRLAHHLLESGRLLEALPILERATRELRSSGRTAEHGQLTSRWGRALASLGCPEDDPAVGSYRLEDLRGRLQAEPTRCRELSLNLAEDVTRFGWTKLLPRTMECWLFEAMARGDYSAVLEGGEHILSSADDLPVRALAHASMGMAYVRLGNLPKAKEHVRLGAADVRGHGHGDGANGERMLIPLCRLAMALRAVGDADSSARILLSASRLAERFGARLVTAELENERGEILRSRGDYETARECYLRSRDLWQAAGNPAVGAVELNLATLALEMGEFDEAEEGFSRCLQPDYVLSSLTRTITYLGLAACAASRGDAASWDGQLTHLLEEEFITSGLHEGDVAKVGALAGGLAEGAGWTDRAALVMSLSGPTAREAQPTAGD
jgi:tetratricopeptide (TPR) repeat protein